VNARGDTSPSAGLHSDSPSLADRYDVDEPEQIHANIGARDPALDYLSLVAPFAK